MGEKMTLEQVRDRMRAKLNMRNGAGSNDLADWINALDAHLTQPAQAVDVVGYCTRDEVAKLLKRKGQPDHNFAAIEVWSKPFLLSAALTAALPKDSNGAEGVGS